METTYRFTNKVAVVTGGASGIGAAIATQLIAEGGAVVIGDVDENQARAFLRTIDNPRLAYQRCDVTDLASLESLIALAEHRFGGLDIMFNNAGTGLLPARAPDTPPGTWRQVMAVNIDAVFYGCHAAVPALRRRGGGAIVNTASISGLSGDYGFSAYSASKGAVINYTRTLALDHSRENIRVNAVCPGYIDTPLTAEIDKTPFGAMWQSAIPMGRAGKPEEIAQVALFLASDAASYVTGAMLVADGGLMAHTGQPNMLGAV